MINDLIVIYFNIFLLFLCSPKDKEAKRKGVRGGKKKLSITRASWRNDAIRYARIVLRRCLAMENVFFSLRRYFVG